VKITKLEFCVPLGWGRVGSRGGRGGWGWGGRGCRGRGWGWGRGGRATATGGASGVRAVLDTRVAVVLGHETSEVEVDGAGRDAPTDTLGVVLVARTGAYARWVQTYAIPFAVRADTPTTIITTELAATGGCAWGVALALNRITYLR